MLFLNVDKINNAVEIGTFGDVFFILLYECDMKVQGYALYILSYNNVLINHKLAVSVIRIAVQTASERPTLCVHRTSTVCTL